MDYVPVNATLTFAPEDYAASNGRWVARKSVALSLVDDSEDELDEQFTLTLSRDASLGDLIQVRNPNRTQCGGSCLARIDITDNDIVGASFLDGDGSPLAGFRLTVREGEQITYQIKLDRRPAQWGLLVWEPGEGDADLVPHGEHSWSFSHGGEQSPNRGGEPSNAAGTGPTGGGNVHHWQEAFSVTVEALQDNDPYPGERRFHHYIVSGDIGQTRIELPDIVVVEVDDEGSGPLGVFGAPEVISEPVSGDTYEVSPTPMPVITSVAGSSVASDVDLSGVGQLPTSIRHHPYRGAQMGNLHAPASAAGRLLRPR